MRRITEETFRILVNARVRAQSDHQVRPHGSTHLGESRQPGAVVEGAGLRGGGAAGGVRGSERVL